MSELPARLLPPAVVSDRTSLSRTTLWRMVKKGEFPKPVQISENRIAWPEPAVAAWITETDQVREAQVWEFAKAFMEGRAPTPNLSVDEVLEDERNVWLPDMRIVVGANYQMFADGLRQDRRLVARQAG